MPKNQDINSERRVRNSAESEKFAAKSERSLSLDEAIAGEEEAAEKVDSDDKAFSQAKAKENPPVTSIPKTADIFVEGMVRYVGGAP